MEFPFKNFMKIGKVVESCGERDFQNGGVSLFKQFYSLFQSKIVEVFHYGHVHVFFEKTHKVIFAEIAFHRSIIPTPAGKNRIVILAIKNSATACI